MRQAQQVTQLLADWSEGDGAALEKLTPLVYEELRHLAHRYMQGQRPDHTLQTTERLAHLDSRKAQVVELKYFGGLNQDEIAHVLKISIVTVRRDWVFARAWLHTELRSAG